MSIAGLGNEIYISPYGANALNEQSFSLKTEEMQPDVYVKKHKEKDNSASVALNALLTIAAAFGIYKGKGQIKTAYNAVKEGFKTARNSVKENGIKGSLQQLASKITGGKAAEEIASLKNKSPKEIFTSCKNYITDGLKSLPEKIQNFVKNFRK